MYICTCMHVDKSNKQLKAYSSIKSGKVPILQLSFTLVLETE